MSEEHVDISWAQRFHHWQHQSTEAEIRATVSRRNSAALAAWMTRRSTRFKCPQLPAPWPLEMQRAFDWSNGIALRNAREWMRDRARIPPRVCRVYDFPSNHREGY
jgi:hypothetical protein